jgi:hypothetical protein
MTDVNFLCLSACKGNFALTQNRLLITVPYIIRVPTYTTDHIVFNNNFIEDYPPYEF